VGDTKPLGDINHPCFAILSYEIIDNLNVILSKLLSTSLASSAVWLWGDLHQDIRRGC